MRFEAKYDRDAEIMLQNLKGTLHYGLHYSIKAIQKVLDKQLYTEFFSHNYLSNMIFITLKIAFYSKRQHIFARILGH